MTRLTKEIREEIRRSIMRDIKRVDYRPLIVKAAQDAIVEHMPETVRAVYEDEKTREYLRTSAVYAQKGNKSIAMYGIDNTVIGTKYYEITLRYEDFSMNRTGKLSQLADILIKNGAAQHIIDHFDQDEKIKSVEARLKSILDKSSTIKSLFANLEPGLHSYIPADNGGSNMPSIIEPIYDDLVMLGLGGK